MRHAKALLGAVAFAGSLAVGTMASEAEELTFAIGLPPSHSWSEAYKYMEEHLAERTNGTLEPKVFYGSLLNLQQALTGVRDGIAQVGFLVPGYHPAELPQTNLIVDLAMVGDDAPVMSAATTEYLFTCPECMAEYKNQGSVFTGMSSNSPYMILSKGPMTTLDSLKGKKLRSFSAFGRWAEYVGAIKVSMSANDIYEALSQGVIDANLHPPSELYNLNFADVVTHVTRLPLGTYQGNSLFNVNNGVWASWTPEQRAAFLEVAAEANAYSSVKHEQFNQQVLNEKAPAGGIKVVEPSPELTAKTREFVEQDLKGIAELAAERYGIDDAQARIDRYRELVKKWKTLLGGIDASDWKQVAELYKKEIYGKVDPASFGM